ncbi:hypothetical protein IKG12_01890 [Candidatus Saccharibacteria bacterium]|nr:hypothetical protein [Candidatus Saccharibacteria bacterium]MBR3233596.1 hypothetical protein [Candidatus Saccharibacteria bacterium]
MRVVIVWNEQTDYAREVRDWMQDFSHDTGGTKEIESLDPETVAGEDFAKVYDIVQYPTIVALDNSGKVLQMWKGTPLPQIEQVAVWAEDK